MVATSRQPAAREGAEARTTGQYIAICRVVSGAADKDRVVIEPGTVFDPTVRETELQPEEIESLIGMGAIRPYEAPDEPDAPAGGPGGGEDTVAGTAARRDSATISRDPPPNESA